MNAVEFHKQVAVTKAHLQSLNQPPTELLDKAIEAAGG
jgi:hypothetical protein